MGSLKRSHDPDWASHHPKQQRLLNEIKPQSSFRGISRNDYSVGWICALPLEMTAAKAMLDEVHPGLEQGSHDNNAYALGRIKDRNVVIACLPKGVYGTTSATTVTTHMQNSFPSVQLWLMVGIGGGVPGKDIRLGDVVVSVPTPGYEGVVQYDYGKTVQKGRFERTGTLNKPASRLLTAVSNLEADHRLKGSQIPSILSAVFQAHRLLAAQSTYPGQHRDVLFEAGYEHNDLESETCLDCDPAKIVTRNARPAPENNPKIHYGLIASGNQVIKHGFTRDRYAKELGILCFEMEAAGIMDTFQCLVIRGICDYCDSHKNKIWQEYAAMVAAAYAKELISSIPRTNGQVKMGVFESDAELAENRSSNAERIENFMSALQFDQIETRHATIKAAHAKTCRWLLKSPEFQTWLAQEKNSRHSNFLWIKGKAGTGKSTIMKFILKTLSRQAVIISFFFNARGEELERSTVGMYRSLLFQLLNKNPYLQNVLLGALQNGKHNEWQIETLQDLFSLAIQNLRQKTLCFIDALDECNQDQIRELVGFLSSSEFTATNFHICFSSRHYPHVTIDSQQLILENQDGHKDDIANYINSELKAKSQSKILQQVKVEILEKASGIFLWVVLVVKILNEECDHGRIHELQKRLREIPNELGQLFKDILTRDQTRIDYLLLCLQWILYAKRPLTPEELYFAILSEDGDLFPWDPDYIPRADMELFILSSSKGLAELTKAKSNQTVQFIHESVRDFLLYQNGFKEIWPEFQGNTTGLSHDRLKQCCLKHVQLDPREIGIPTKLPAANTENAAQLRELISKKFPLLQYAVLNVLYHANAAEGNGILQATFIESFPLVKTILLDNVFEKHQVRRHSHEDSLLYILAEKNLPHLIKFELNRAGTMKTFGKRHSYPLLVALANKNKEAVEALLRYSPEAKFEESALPGINQELAQTFSRLEGFKLRKGQNLFSALSELGFHQIGLLLIDSEADNLDVLNSAGRTPLSYAAEAGHEEAVKQLLVNGVNPDAKDKYRRTPFSYAALNCHEKVVQLLLATGQVDPDAKDDGGLTPLSRAALNGHEKVVQLLLATGQVDPDAKDKYGRTLLSGAACDGHEKVVQLLLATGQVDPDAKDDGGLTPLSRAALNGHEKVVQLLLATGQVNPDAKDNYGLTPSSRAAWDGHEKVVQLLLATGQVDPDAKDDGGRTPLSRAALNGHEKVVQLLLVTGQANPDAKDHYGLTPSSRAASNGHEKVVQLLLATGQVNPDAKDDDGRTPLSRAASNGHEKVVQLLLATGQVNPDAKDKYGLTPLSRAACDGHEKVVQLLLATGQVDLDAKDKYGRAPLSYAAEAGHEKVVQLLLATGQVDLDAKDQYGRAPLSYAAEAGHEKVVQLLLATGQVDPDAKANDRRTPLSYAAENGHERVVQLLSATGQVDPDSKDITGQTPLSHAQSNTRLSYNLQSYEAIFKHLQEYKEKLQ